jgi:protein Mpv17
VWFKVLEKFVVIKKSVWAQTFARVAADQLLFAPVGIAAFFSAMAVLEGGNTTDVKKKLDSTWWPTLKTNWNLWPAVQLVNFSFVPLNLRIVVVNVISICKLIFGPVMMGLDADHD